MYTLFLQHYPLFSPTRKACNSPDKHPTNAMSPFKLNAALAMFDSTNTVPSGITSAPSIDRVLNASASRNPSNFDFDNTRQQICTISKSWATTTVTMFGDATNKNRESGETSMEWGFVTGVWFDRFINRPVEEENVKKDQDVTTTTKDELGINRTK